MQILDSIMNRLGYAKKGVSKRGYAAAKIDRLTGDWLTTNRSADAEIRYSLKVLRARSRELIINNDYARKFMRLCDTNIVGPAGITFQNKAKDPSGNLDAEANGAIETAFAEWSKRGTASICGKFSWVGLQRLVVKSVVRDGEVFVRKVRGAKNKFRFSLQLIEADRLDENHNETLKNGHRIRMGVEIDPWGKPAAYHISVAHPGDYDTAALGGNKIERVAAEDIIHVFDPDRITQTRGVPWMHAAMTRLNMLGGYEEAELVAARVSAAKMGFFTQTQEGSVGNLSTTDDKGEMQLEAEPGTFEQLPPGLDFKPWDPTHPGGNFPSFCKKMLQGVASGLGVSYNTLASDLESVNYSSIRSGTLEERDNWRILQSWFIEAFVNEVFVEWLDLALLSGAIPLPYGKIKKFNAPSWQVRGWQWVDPLKDVMANVDAIKNGLKTRQMVLAEQGVDIEDIFEQLQSEKESASGFNLAIDTDEITQVYQYHIENGIVTLNEAREKIGFPPVKGGDALLPPRYAAQEAAGNAVKKPIAIKEEIKEKIKKEAVDEDD